MAYNRNDRILTPVTLSDKPYNFKDKKSISIHLNGFINRLTPDTLNKEFKLSEISYLTHDFINNDWGSLFRQDLVTSDAIFFVGFSLNYDLDLKRVIYSTPELLEKCFFILSDKENETTLRNVKKFGIPIPIGLEKFAQQVEKQKISYVPRAKTNTRFLCFLRPLFNNTPPDIRDKDFFRLLVKGEINPHLLQYSVISLK
jgi:hypothetical protein